MPVSPRTEDFVNFQRYPLDVLRTCCVAAIAVAFHFSLITPAHYGRLSATEALSSQRLQIQVNGEADRAISLNTDRNVRCLFECLN